MTVLSLKCRGYLLATEDKVDFGEWALMLDWHLRYINLTQPAKITNLLSLTC